MSSSGEVLMKACIRGTNTHNYLEDTIESKVKEWLCR